MPLSVQRPLPPEIKAAQDSLAEIARGYGLDFPETIFEMLDYEEISMFAAFGGFPVPSSSVTTAHKGRHTFVSSLKRQK